MNTFLEWINHLTDEWDEEFYRVIYEVYLILSLLEKNREARSVYLKIEVQDDGFLLQDRHTDSSCLLPKTAVSESLEQLAQRFRVENNSKAWEAWENRQHEWLRSDRSDWV